jgi:3-deoxy-D-manno-octulosonate 8-phosphate phosphatase (KDO 8-P phosphatase)
MPKPTAAILRRARCIKLLLLDVDGVMTDGSISLASEPGSQAREIKSFNSLDGAGIRLAQLAGLRTGVITGRVSAAVAARAKELGMDYIAQDVFMKLPAFEKILRQARVKPDEVCFIGDDITDLPVLSRAGLAVSVPNGHEEVRRRVHYITRRSGGQGAVREVVDLILRAQGKYDKLLRRFLS